LPLPSTNILTNNDIITTHVSEVRCDRPSSESNTTVSLTQNLIKKTPSDALELLDTDGKTRRGL
jgi:hypothetical protein